MDEQLSAAPDTAEDVTTSPESAPEAADPGSSRPANEDTVPLWEPDSREDAVTIPIWSPGENSSMPEAPVSDEALGLQSVPVIELSELEPPASDDVHRMEAVPVVDLSESETPVSDDAVGTATVPVVDLSEPEPPVSHEAPGVEGVPLVDLSEFVCTTPEMEPAISTADPTIVSAPNEDVEPRSSVGAPPDSVPVTASLEDDVPVTDVEVTDMDVTDLDVAHEEDAPLEDAPVAQASAEIAEMPHDEPAGSRDSDPDAVARASTGGGRAVPTPLLTGPSRVDELLAEIHQTMAAERDRLASQAWAEADAWAADHLAAEIQRVRAEADARLTEEVARLESEIEGARQEADRARAEEASRVEATVADRIEQALAEERQQHAAEVARIKAQAEELLAQRFYAGIAPPDEPQPATNPGVADAPIDLEEKIDRARLEERQAVLTEIDRLRRTLSQLDDSRSLGEILRTLGQALQPEVARLAIIRVTETGPVLWEAAGFSPPLEMVSITLDPDAPGVIGRVMESGIPSFAQPRPDGRADVELASVPVHAVALAVPLLVGGQVVAVVYADDAGREGFANTWPEVVGVLVNHAARCLDALSALMRASGEVPTPDAGAFDRRFAAAGDYWEQIDPPAGAGESAASPPAHVERRTSIRVPASELPWLGEVKIKPGHDATLVDVSNGGALVDAASRLAPGTNVLLHFMGSAGQRVRGQVLRCAVYSFDDKNDVRYRGAVKFSEPLSEFFERAAIDGMLAPINGTIEIAADDSPVQERTAEG